MLNLIHLYTLFLQEQAKREKHLDYKMRLVKHLHLHHKREKIKSPLIKVAVRPKKVSDFWSLTRWSVAMDFAPAQVATRN